MPTSTYDLIASNVLTSSASSVTFSSIPATYRDLILVVQVLGSGGNAGVRFRFNGDTGSNYPYVLMQGDGSSAVSDASTSSLVDGYFADTTQRDLEILQVMDYSATDKHKTILLRSGRPSGVTRTQAARWANTAAVNQIEVFSSNSPYASGATFYLYGIAS